MKIVRNRRDQEKNEVSELAQLLPLSPAIKDQLDRVSVVKMTTAYFSLKNIIYGDGQDEQKLWSNFDLFKMFRNQNPYLREPIENFTTNTLQTSDGFVLVLDNNGKIIYVSETAAVHLGVAQVNMIGTTIMDHLHLGDIPTIQFKLAIGFEQETISIDNPEVCFTSRWRCCLAKRNAGITTEGHKVIYFVGRIFPENKCRFIGYGLPLVSYGLNEMRLRRTQFVFRTNLSLQIVFMDSCIYNLLGYGAKNLVDKSFYQLVHAEDVELVREAHRTVIEKHQASIDCYKLLSNNEGSCWVETKLVMIHLQKKTHLDTEGSEIMDLIQTTAVRKTDHGVLGEYSQNHYDTFALKHSPEPDSNFM